MSSSFAGRFGRGRPFAGAYWSRGRDLKTAFAINARSSVCLKASRLFEFACAFDAYSTPSHFSPSESIAL